MKRYERTFKEHAVNLSYGRQKGQLAACARELGIAPDYLYKWRQDFEEYAQGSFCGSGHPKMTPREAVIAGLEKKIRDSKITLEILKKGTRYVSQGKISIKDFIENNKAQYSIQKICAVLQVSETTYYRRKKQEVTDTEARVMLLKEQITAVFYEFQRSYGSSKITAELQKRGFKIKNSAVKSYMRMLGLRSIARRTYKATTDSYHNCYTAPNVLNREFKVSRPAAVWVSDITYIQTSKGFLYLTIIMDLFDRKIIGWNLGTRMSTKATVLPAWEMAAAARAVTKNLIFHSDRGIQYANKLFTGKLDSYRCITRSMSRRQNHNDNAVCESFFGSFKRELLNREKLLSRKQMRLQVHNYIENWYNTNRRHSALGYKTIREFNAVNSG